MAQEAWTKGWERLDQLRDSGRILPWINTIAINLYRSLRTTTRYELPLDGHTAEIASACAELKACEARSVLDKCREQDSELLQSHYCRGFSIGEIARQNNWSDGATRTRLLRARRRSRSRITGV